MDINSAFGEVLKTQRLKKKLTQDELAESAGIAKMYLWRLEKGKQSPTIETLYMLANALDIKAEKLISETSKLKTV